MGKKGLKVLTIPKLKNPKKRSSLDFLALTKNDSNIDQLSKMFYPENDRQKMKTKKTCRDLDQEIVLVLAQKSDTQKNFKQSRANLKTIIKKNFIQV